MKDALITQETKVSGGLCQESGAEINIYFSYYFIASLGDILVVFHCGFNS